MNEQSSARTRMDKFLWAVRMFKTRSLAAEACDKGRVRIDDVSIKSSRSVKPGEIIVIHRGAWYQHISVTALTERRMSASAVHDFILDVTPETERERLKLHQAAMAAFNVGSGAGRPTKRDRRQMDEFMGDW
jgi:ribosome-associated heat shock protein Hsp15